MSSEVPFARTPSPYYAVVFTSINADVDHTEHVAMSAAGLRLHEEHAVRLEVAGQVVEVGAGAEPVVGVVGTHLLVTGGDDQRLAVHDRRWRVQRVHLTSACDHR